MLEAALASVRHGRDSERFGEPLFEGRHAQVRRTRRVVQRHVLLEIRLQEFHAAFERFDCVFSLVALGARGEVRCCVGKGDELKCLEAQPRKGCAFVDVPE